MVKNGIAYIVDAQVVKCTDLESDHNIKVRKYAESVGLKESIQQIYGVRDVKFHACTTSYKGIWSRKSADEMKRLCYEVHG